MSRLNKDVTLGDMYEDDKNNFAEVNAKSLVYKHATAEDAQMFSAKKMFKALALLGIKVGLHTRKEALDKMLHKHNVVVEHREYSSEDTAYLSGFFIYKYSEMHQNATKELAYFISNAYTQTDGLITLPYKSFYVKTNV